MSHSEWESYVTEVRERSAGLLRGLVEERARLTPVGRGKYKCRSPVREGDQDPSFHLNEDLGFWHDFGTGESGDAITFVRRVANLSFREAVDDLAKRSGVATWDERKKTNGAARLGPDDLLSLWREEEDAHEVRRLVTEIAVMCHDLMPGRVRAHLRDHCGFSDETIDDQRVGFVPDGLFPLCREVWPDVDETTLMATGYFLRTSEGVKTHLGGRILFPYWKDGQVAYTIGRQHHFGVPESQVAVEDHDKGKYKKHLTHSPSHPYVSPCISNDHFWGEDSLRGRRGETALVTEGVTDAVTLLELGFPVISPVTTGFKEKTVPRAAELLRSSKEAVILNDNEQKVDARTGEVRNPGMEGAVRMAEALHLLRVPVRIGVLTRPVGSSKIDVNELCASILRRGGTRDDARRAISDVVARARPVADHLLSTLGPSATDEEKSALVRRVAALSAHLGDTEADLVAARTSAALKVKRSSVDREIAQARRERAKREKEERKDLERSSGVDERRRKVVRDVFDQLTYYDKSVRGEDAPVAISTFSLVLKHVLVTADDEIEVLACDVIGQSGEVIHKDWAVPPKAWSSSRDFVRSFPSIYMQWFGSDVDVMAVYRMVSQNAASARRIRVVRAMGVCEVSAGRRFAMPAGTMDERGWMPQPDVVFRPERGSTMQALLPSAQTDPTSHVDLLRAVLARSYELQCPDFAFPAAAWCAASLFKPDLIERGYSGFPILMVYGTKGSGKTSATRLLWRLFTGGRKSSLGSSGTKFALSSDASSTTSLPVFFDEYRPEQMTPQDVSALKTKLRLAYDGAVESKGRQNLTMTTYEFSSPIIVAGEHALDDDPALVERLVFASSDKNWLERSDKHAFASLSAEPVERCAPYVHMWRVRTDVDALRGRALEVTDAHFASGGAARTLSRVRSNVEQLVVGHFALAALAASVGAALPPVDLHERIDAALARISGVDRADAAGGEAQAPRTALDAFLSDFCVMAVQGVVEEDVHYAQIKDDLFVHTESVYAARSAWRRQSGMPGDGVGVRGLRQIAAESMESGGYVKEVSHVARLRVRGDQRPPTTTQELRLAEREYSMVTTASLEDQPGVQVRGLLIDFAKLPDWVGRPPVRFRRVQGRRTDVNRDIWAVTVKN